MVKTERLNSAALTDRDAALKGKLDQFLEKSIAELGKLTELFPDREGPDDPELAHQSRRCDDECAAEKSDRQAE